ncbi:hypothetical protein V501_01973 [Pseudogymnoascus sp. VKM F-4519 (FW-2642)]|nr:hypothetical protein V501_01973 [Pseudogymnoascus sp. VKM F-4519 (FW-2642)]
MSPPKQQEGEAEPDRDLENKPKLDEIDTVVGDRSGTNDDPVGIAGEELQDAGSTAGPSDTGKVIEDTMGEAGTASVSTGETALEENAVESHEDQQTTLDAPTTEASTTEEPTTEDKYVGSDPMESSTATLRPHPPPNNESNTTQVPTKDNMFLEPTPHPPHSAVPPASNSASTSTPRSGAGESPSDRSPTRSDAGFDEKPSPSEDGREGESRSEIQSIMDQFSAEGGGPGEEEVMSPRFELAGPLLGTQIQHPPRKSSLDPLNHGVINISQGLESTDLGKGVSSRRESKDSDIGPEVPPKPTSMYAMPPMRSSEGQIESPVSPHATSLHRPPPPEPEPEPDLPFDFHRFLEQLRHRTADPVAKFLRSFLQEFGKKQWMVHEQVKIIGDFLAFITNKMAQCEIWKEVSDAEFDNAREGMEKLVMNRLYTQTFSPAIPPPQPIPGARPRRRNGERPLGPGRRGQHQEDVERDDILAQKVSIYGWVKEDHLDIPPVGESGKRFLILAQQELLKIKTYRAPRDKIICVLNCCKVIFGLLKHSKSDSSADSFMPLLIYTVLQANPEHLVSNVQYILRFRNQEKLGGEAGYYLSSLLGAVQFIENLDRTTLTISDEDFEKNVEAAVFAIAEKHRTDEADAPPTPTQQLSEKSGQPSSEPNFGKSSEAESSQPRKSTSSYESNNADGGDEKAAMGGLLRSIQRPLSSIGRIFADDSSQGSPSRGPASGNTSRLSPAPRNAERPISPQRLVEPTRDTVDRNHLRAENAAVRQASVETAEAQHLERAEHENVVETLSGMFPDLDKELISDVVAQKNGRVGLAVDACLALSS